MTLRKTADLTKDCTCLECHEPMSMDVGVRSLTWFSIPGVRALLCSITCRDLWDLDNATKEA